MLEKGDILQNRYRIIRQLGEGGMGAVYAAEDSQRFGKPVALKEILVDLTKKHSEHFRRAFEREAKILTQIDHEAVPRVIGYFQETERQILVMELIEGDDLDEILEQRGKPFRLAEVLNWANQLLDALDYLHTLRQPIIHRDIKPQNLKLTARGKIKLLDFGIAKDSEAELSMTKSAHKTFVGASLYYSPIEQIIRFPDSFDLIESVYPEKAKKIVRQSSDARTDIYALGTTLYHLLTNEFPKPAHLRAFEVWAGKADVLKPLHTLNPEVPIEISDCLHKAMEIEREDRYVSAFEMQTALQTATSHEKHRREEEERKLWLAEQARIRQEREELEAERRQLEADRQKYKNSDAETERKRKEQLEYEERLKRWQSENFKDKDFSDEKYQKHLRRANHEQENLKDEDFSDEKKPLADTQPSDENFPPKDTFDWAELAEKKPLMETSSPSFLIDFEFEREKTKPNADTIENAKPKTAPNIPAPTNADKRRAFWILPVAIAAIFIFGISALGIFLFFINSGGSENKPSITNTPTTPTISPTPMPTKIVSPVYIKNSVGMEFAKIPSGSFIMGDKKGDSDEKPIHEVTISNGFLMGKTEVTQRQWKAVMGSLPDEMSGVAQEYIGDNKPVIMVSWEDIQDFIRNLNKKDKAVYRLPTEAEWEYACRAGTTTQYISGDGFTTSLNKYAWFAGRNPNEVAMKQPNAWGLYDMHGNVWEWTQDWYGIYTSDSVIDPKGADSGEYRVSRGGSWKMSARYASSGKRQESEPSDRKDDLGFRVVKQ